MKIQKNCVVSMHYTLTDDNGQVVDSSQDRDALDYIQGYGMIVPGLEKNMEGKAIGEKFSVKVEPAEGYGEYRSELVQEVPRSVFQGVDEIEVGMNFIANSPEGQMMVTITAVKGDNVEINGNHPLAGQNLNFDIEVVSVREATADELEKGLGGGCGDCSGNEDCDEDNDCGGNCGCD
ncbi:MAG: peptidylprolyl isomerase [Fibrobacter sp.]|nr:peptidylprolyl isomerase [Fibrobacter sp.]